MMNPIQFLRATNRTLPVLVLLQYVGHPLTAAQVGKYLGVQVRTALGYLNSLACMDPPLVADMGNGQFTLIAGELPLLTASADACSSVDNLPDSVDNFAPDPARNAHEEPQAARNAREDPDPTPENARNARAGVRETRTNIKNSAQNAPETPEKSTEIYCAKRAQEHLKLKLKKERKEDIESEKLSFFLSSASGEIIDLATDLRSEGLYDDIVLKTLQAYEPEYIREKLSYYRHARQAGSARGPGWLSRALKLNFGPPAGYHPPEGDHPDKYIAGDYSEFINY